MFEKGATKFIGAKNHISLKNGFISDGIRKAFNAAFLIKYPFL